MDNIFTVLNWILRKTKKQNFSTQTTSVYMLNRWLSMSDPSVANIVNSTGNRWSGNNLMARNIDFISKFYFKILPKINSKINYTKKPDKKNEEQDLLDMASNLERSTRELEILNRALENINSNNI